MKILITGASGFLGSSFAAKAGAAHELHALSRTRPDVPVQNWSCQDLGAPLTNVGDGPIDAVVHLAQSDRFRDFPGGMQDIIDINVVSTARLLDLAIARGAKKFILASTGSVYPGIPDLQRESIEVSPMDAYPVSKYASELITRPYAGLLQVVILRFFFPYGPTQTNMFLPSIVSRISTGEPVTLQGDEEGLVFCPGYVDDVADVILRSLSDDVEGLFNVASPESITLRKASEMIGEQIGKTPKFMFEPEAAKMIYRPALAELRKWFDVDSGFRPFEQGLADTLSSPLKVASE